MTALALDTWALRRARDRLQIREALKSDASAVFNSDIAAILKPGAAKPFRWVPAVSTWSREEEDIYARKSQREDALIVAILENVSSQTTERPMLITWSEATGSANSFGDPSRIFGISSGVVVYIEEPRNNALVVIGANTDIEVDRSGYRLYSAALAEAWQAGKWVEPKDDGVPLEVSLSTRQREVLQWVRAGKSDWDIAQILGVSEHTVRDHVRAAMNRLGVRTRTQAVIEAIFHKLISI